MNFKNILSSFGSWIFIVITGLGFLILYAGIGGRGRFKIPGETNIYFIGVGIILILPFLFYLAKTSYQLAKANETESDRIQTLIKSGDQIIVNLDLLDIRTNSYLKEIEVGSGYRTRNETIEVNHNVIQIEIPYQDTIISYKVNVDMDPTKLKLHLVVQKETLFYVDPKNPDNNFLDLRFLVS